MKEITLTINDNKLKAKEGSTVLEICKSNGIDIPTLCHLDGLTDVGACRLCVVEIQGERRPVPSCTYPVREGLVVQTHTPKLEKYRRMLLELLFTERNHFCMFCEKSGDCELQKLAYRYQMDHVRFPYSFPSLPVDTISSYLVVDHNRCILCGRCIRTCNEVVANHTLDFGKRGWRTIVTADLEQSFGESSCISCGACMQVCPTGAIFSKLSLYKGKVSECQQVRTVCPTCGAGCELNVLVKDNNLVMIEAPGITDPKSPLCYAGRFELLDGNRARVTTPMVKNKHGNLEECTLEKASEVIAEKMAQLKGKTGAIVSTKYPSELLVSFQKFINETAGSQYVDTLDGRQYRFIAEGIKHFWKDAKLGIECAADEILKADCIMIVSADPMKTNPVTGSLIRRAISQNKANLIVINPARDVFPLLTTLWLKPSPGSEEVLLKGLLKLLIDKGTIKKEKVSPELSGYIGNYKPEETCKAAGVKLEDLESAAKTYGQAKHAVIIYGNGLLLENDSRLVADLLSMADLTGNWSGDRIRVISLKPSSNSRGAWELGLAAREIPRDKVKGAYLMLGSDTVEEDLLDWLKEIDFLVVQATYHSPVTSIASVVLPSPTWAEREGKYTSMDGLTQQSRKVLQSKDGALTDIEILDKIATKMGHKTTPGQEVKHG